MPKQTKVHSTVVVPYIKALLKNTGKSLGDNIQEISIAVNSFDPSNKTELTNDFDDKLITYVLHSAFILMKLRQDGHAFAVSGSDAAILSCRSSTESYAISDKIYNASGQCQYESTVTSTIVLKKLITADLPDAFPTL